MFGLLRDDLRSRDRADYSREPVAQAAHPPLDPLVIDVNVDNSAHYATIAACSPP